MARLEERNSRAVLTALAFAAALAPSPTLAVIGGEEAAPGAEVRPLPAPERRVLVTRALVRAGPTPEAPVVGAVPMGAAVEADAATADAAFLHVEAAGGAGPAGWIWAPLARPDRPAPPSRAAEPAPGPEGSATPETRRHLERYREALHAALARRGLDPRSKDTAEAVGLFRGIVLRVRAEYVRPVDLGALVDAAVAALARDPPAGGGPASPQDVVLASLRPALAGLDEASTVVTRAELDRADAPIRDDTRPRAEDGPGEEAGAAGILFMRVTGFPRGTAEAARRFIEGNLPAAGGPADRQAGAIVVDLRGNAGGRLDEAAAFADLFLHGGEIGRVVARAPAGGAVRVAAPGDVAAGVPLVVLVDEDTVSVAELAAGALQASGRALLAGRGTAGAAAVQTIMPLAGGRGALVLTTGALALPGGRDFACRGLEPDIRLGGTAADRPIAIDRPGRVGCAASPLAAPAPRSREEACPIPGAGRAIRHAAACVVQALRTHVVGAAAPVR